MVIELPPALLVVGVFGVLVRDAVVDTYPFVSMIVCSHAIVEHSPSFLDEFGEEAARALVLGILVDVAHQQDDLLAHDRALNGCTAVVQQVSLVFFYM